MFEKQSRLDPAIPKHPVEVSGVQQQVLVLHSQDQTPL